MTGIIRKPALSRPSSRRRFVVGAGAGLAGIIASGRAPAFAQGAAPKKLVYAHIVPEPESGAVGFAWMAQEIGKRSKFSCRRPLLAFDWFDRSSLPCIAAFDPARFA